MKRSYTLKSIGKVRVRSALKQYVLLLIVLLGVVFQGNTQTSDKGVPGRVVDQFGQPISGATISVEGTSRKTMTDSNGEFAIQTSRNDNLLITAMGYQPQNVTYTNQTNLLITLTENVTSLEEVVAVAYGTQKKVSVVGAVASVSRKEVLQSSAPNLAASLAGRLPGLTTMQTSGQPGRDDVEMYIRGVSTFGGGTQPLILIDGIPRSNISSLNPSDIETISILKDASATAVFGVRGANGVILITTRRGKEGKMDFDVMVKHSLQSPLYHRDFVNSWEFAHLRNEALLNDGKLPEFDDVDIMKFKNGGNPFYPNRDVMDEIFKKFSPQSQVTMNTSGGTNSLQYYVSAGFLNQGSSFRQDIDHSSRGYDPSFKLNRYNLRLNLDYELTKGLNANLDLGSDISEANSPLAGGLTGIDFNSVAGRLLDFVRKTRPVDVGPLTVAGFKNNFGEDVPAGIPLYPQGGFNFWELMNANGYSKQTTANFNSSLGLNWDLGFITPGLSTKGLVAFDVFGISTLLGRSSGDHRYIVYDRKDETYFWSEPADSGNQIANIVNLSRNYMSDYKINMQYQVNYNRTFNDVHSVGGLFLAQRDNWIYQSSGEHALPFNMLGVAGRATYAYDNKYLAEINVGYNGSEQFSPTRRFGFFPAYSLGWVISNENFMKGIDQISMLKLRGSYGKVGNDKLGANQRSSARFLYLDNISITGGGLFNSFGLGNRVNFNLVGNPNLSWETELKRNIGLDLELKNGFYLNFDYFNNYRKGILIVNNNIPSFQGITQLPLLNIGEMKNWGYEAVIGYKKVFNEDFSLNATANLSFNDNEVVNSSEQMRAEDFLHRNRSEGYRFRQNWGYKIDYSNGNGYINTDEELAIYKPMYENGTVGSPIKGDIVYQDLNGDGKITEADQVPIGWSYIPRISFSTFISTQYKAFDFSFQLQGITQASYGSEMFINEAPDGFAGYYNGVHRKAWTEERYLNNQEILHPALHMSPANASRHNNDYFIQDRSYLRLKLIELGYTLPKSYMESVGIKNARVSFSGQNMFTFNRLKSTDIDPEQNSAYSYPLSRIMTFNLSVNF